MFEGSTRRRGLAVAAAAAALGLLAGACSSASDSEDATTETSVRGVAETDVTIAATGEPTPGGDLVYGLEAETDGFDPTKNRWAISGMMVGMAVYDPLTAMNADVEPRPYLAESIEPNDDYTVWTITLRPDVTFHDGTPLTAEAVKGTLEGHKASILTSSAVGPIDTIEVVDELTAQVNMSLPWVAFPAALTSQIGFVVSPATLADPDGSRSPIGTGPFVFEEWIPDASWTGSRNEAYWRDGLPYLDSVEFRPIKEAQARAQSLETGEIDIMHTTNTPTIVDFREQAAAGEVQIVEDRGEGEESFVMFNLDAPPLDDVRVRRGLAMATDVETYVALVSQNVPEVATGVFNPRSPWYVETDHPTYDPEGAAALIAEYEAEVGPVQVTLATTPSPENSEAIQLLANMWEEAGAEVALETVDQTTFIGNAIAGTYSAHLWRQFGAPEPDVDYVWWASETGGATNVLNFARWYAEDKDEALLEGRTNPDPAARQQAYAELQEYMARDLPYLWLSHSVWAIIADNSVRGITNGTLPDGEDAIPLGGTGTFGGTHRLVETWFEA